MSAPVAVLDHRTCVDCGKAFRFHLLASVRVRCPSGDQGGRYHVGGEESAALASTQWGCPSCGGAATTGGFAHRVGCPETNGARYTLSAGSSAGPARFTLPEVADLLEQNLGPSDAVSWLRKEAARG